MIDLDFLEIGTSNFDTLIEAATDETKGISIEPLDFYLNQLPNKKNVKKINCAISFDNTESDITFFYIDENTIKENNLPQWLRGCNSLGDYHLQHKNLKIEHLVKITTVKQRPLSAILIENNIRNIKYLKIDTEGGDSDILLNLSNYLKEKERIYYPEIITFETNELTKKEKINEVLNVYYSLGYRKGTKAGKGNTKLIKTIK